MGHFFGTPGIYLGKVTKFLLSFQSCSPETTEEVKNTPLPSVLIGLKLILWFISRPATKSSKMESTRLKWNDLQSTYNIDDKTLRSLSLHLTNMVIQEDGFNNVNIEDDRQIVDLMRRITSCVFGKRARNYIVISGSVAQGLKCENPSNRGDVDILLISDYPEVNVNDQRLYLVGQPEPGFFRIKTISAKFPVFRRDGEFYLSASSLRNLESIWWPTVIKMALVILDKQQEFYGLFNEYDKPLTGVASDIKWRSNLSPVDCEEVYFKMLQESHRQNLFYLLSKPQQEYARKVLGLISNVFAIDRIYTDVDVLKGKESIRNIEAEIGESGVIMRALEYLTTKPEGSHKSIVDPRFLDSFELICRYFDNTVRSQISTDEKRKHRKTEGYIDLVPAIRCSGFPETITADWSKRVANSNWPGEAIVAEVVNGGFHLVPKTSMLEAGDADVDFRISFSTSETILAQNLSKFKKECLRVFKMYYYEHLKSEPAVLETYHLKTIFFWLLEEIEPNVWCENNRAVIFYLLMDKLFSHLKEHKLPHYFIPQNNLFQHMDTKMLDHLAQVVEDIMKDPIGKAGEKIEEVMEYYRLKNKARKEDKDESLDAIDRNLLEERHRIRKTALQILEDSAGKQWQFEVQDVMLNSEDVKSLLADTRTRSLLLFCFDVIYAKHAALAIDHSSKSDREKFLHSPFAIFTLFVLPLSDSILKEVFTRHLDNDNTIMKRINEVDHVIKIASSLGIASTHDNTDLIDTVFKIAETFSTVKKATQKRKASPAGSGHSGRNNLLQTVLQFAGQLASGSSDAEDMVQGVAQIADLFASGFSNREKVAEKKQVVDDMDLD